ncbi:GH3 auxin-responsive promoter family protein, partial [Pseudomonas savastanoi]
MSRKNLPIDWYGRKNEFLHECVIAYDQYMTSLKHPKQAQLEVLQDIIGISRNALHWREHGYNDSVTDEESFRNILPIMRYEDFEPYGRSEVAGCFPATESSALFKKRCMS